MSQTVHRAAVRCHRMKTMQALVAASNHSQRLDGSSKSRLRGGAPLGDGLTWSALYRDESFDRSDFAAARDVVAAYRAHKTRHGIVADRGDLGAHIILSVTGAWIAETGGLHDRDNPRNREVFAQAVYWAEAAFGIGSVYHARMDLDEEGGGVVDVFVAPVRIDGRTKKPRISMNKALNAIQTRHGRRKSYEAIQDDWAQWCRSRLSPTIQRGVPKAETRAENLGVEEYKQARRLAEAKIEQDMKRAARDRLLAGEELVKVRTLRDRLSNALLLGRREFSLLRGIRLTAAERSNAIASVEQIQQLEEEVVVIIPEGPRP